MDTSKNSLGQGMSPVEDELVNVHDPSSFDRRTAAIWIGLTAAPLGAFLGSFGYVIVVLILEGSYVPPLHSPESYGQFGILPIMLGFWGGVFGASFAAIPYVRFVVWLPLFLLILFFAALIDPVRDFDPYDVTCTAMIIIGLIFILLAFVTSIGLGRWQS